MAKKNDKTNVMRILDSKKIEYKEYTYECENALGGMEVAESLNQNPDQVFKTLVTVGASRANYVFVVPVNRELNLKKAAKAVNEKNIAMIKSKDLLGLTGYVHGGCSPIGMKKQFVTVFHESAEAFDTVIFSGGKIGYQVEVRLKDIEEIISYKIYDITD